MGSKMMLGFAAVSTLLVGCAGYQVVPTPAPADALFAPAPAGMSKVCILRPQSKVLATTAVVRDNDHLVGGTDGESYFCYTAQPGEHRIVAEAERQSAEVVANTKAGSTYYLKQDVQTGTETTISWNPLSYPEARESSRGLRYMTLAQAKGEALPDANAVAPAAIDSPTAMAARPSNH